MINVVLKKKNALLILSSVIIIIGLEGTFMACSNHGKGVSSSNESGSKNQGAIEQQIQQTGDENEDQESTEQTIGEKKKIKIPKEWLYTDKMTEILDRSIIIPEGSSYEKEILERGIYIVPFGSVIGSISTEKAPFKEPDLTDFRQFVSDRENPDLFQIFFIPINANEFHHSLLVYNRSNDCFYHYDSLSQCNYDFVKKCIKGKEVIPIKTPSQSEEG